MRGARTEYKKIRTRINPYLDTFHAVNTAEDDINGLQISIKL